MSKGLQRLHGEGTGGEDGVPNLQGDRPHRPDCPGRVNKVSHLSGSLPPSLPLRAGTIAGKGVGDILLDTGATVSLVARDLLRENFQKAGAVSVKGVGSEPKKYHTTMVPV